MPSGNKQLPEAKLTKVYDAVFTRPQSVNTVPWIEPVFISTPVLLNLFQEATRIYLRFCHCLTLRWHGWLKSFNSMVADDLATPRVRVQCDSKPRQVGLNHDYNMIFSLSPCRCQYSPLEYEYGARNESRFVCYFHCYVTWCPFDDRIIDDRDM